MQPRQPRAGNFVARVLAVLSPLIFLAGCARFHQETHTYVYVSARQVYLHDRVAAVSNRVALVTNGEALEVLERGKRFIKVKTPKGEIGWLEEHAVIDDKEYAQFEDLAKKHSGDPVVVKATLRDDLYLHVGPGRDAEHFLLIPGNAKVDLLARGTVARTSGPGGVPLAKAKSPILLPSTQGSGAKTAALTAKLAPPKAATVAPSSGPNAAPAMNPASDPAPIPMEDWWLVRDSAGHTGWLLAGRLDVDIPEEVGGYAEGARMVGAYPIATVTDSGVERKAEKRGKDGKPVKAVTVDETPVAPVSAEHTEYVTVLSPNKGGLPYDFDQVRVFTWSMNHHRYETGFRMRGIQGYLPVRIGQETVNGQSMPTFSFEIASGPNVSIDPETGVTRPVSPRTIVFRLEGNLVRRTGADQLPIPAMHDAQDPNQPKTAKAKATAKKKKR